MKSKKIMCVIAVICILIFICVKIYSNIFYVKIGSITYKKDIKDLSVYSLNDSDIKKINKCNEIERMFLSDVSENSVSKLKNFHNLKHFSIFFSKISSSDLEKISKFDNLEEFSIGYSDSNVDFKGFNSDSVSCIRMGNEKIKNLNALSECQSLKSITIGSILYDNYIVFENNKYVMKDSSVFSSFDGVEELRIFMNIEDVSGFLEMDSLKKLEVDKGTISDENIKLLEDNGISVIEN